MNGTGGSRTAHIVRETEFGVTDLSRACLATKLLEDLHGLTRTRGTQRVTFCLQSARPVDRGTALVSAPLAVSCEPSTLPNIGETKVFCGQEFGDSKAIVNFGQV
tara:strand:- start:3 stop:317 length:315 start_codon:yes stop_codon:yes gene_type:complete